MEHVSKFSNHGLEACAFYSTSMSELDFVEYDVVVLCSSWDSRCLNIAQSSIRKIPYGVVFLFDDKDDQGSRESNDAEILLWLKNSVDTFDEIHGHSTDVDTNFFELYKFLVVKCIDLGRPLTVLFDLSTCPRFISLSLLSKGVNTGIIKGIDYLYGECLYPERKSGIMGGNQEIVFTSGQWKILPIKHLLGEYVPGKRSKFTISVGFEGNKILRVLNNEDPDIVSLLVPDPGFHDSYVKRVMEANAELVKSYEIKENDMIRSCAGDAIDAWMKLDVSNSLSRAEEYNHTYLCTGSKAHSLGLTLSAMSSGSIAVLYSLPKEHNFINVKPENKYWIYRVMSLTVPTLSFD